MKKVLVVGMLILVASIGLTAISNTYVVFAQGGCGAGGCSPSMEQPNSGYRGGFGSGGSPSETPSGQFPPIQGHGGGFGGLDNPKFGVPCGGGSGGASSGDEQVVGGGGGTSCPQSK